MVAFSTPPAKLEELRTVFVKMDEDDSGTLSLGEFKKAMALHPEIPMEQVSGPRPSARAPLLLGAPLLSARR